MRLSFTYTAISWRVEEEDGEIDGLEHEPSAVDGDNESAVVYFHYGNTVEYPEHTVEKGCYVWHGGEILHILLLVYLVKSWPATR